MTPHAPSPTVRLLHTSDWHIGRKFHQVDLLDQQALFGDWLVDLVKAEGIDAVLIAGDLFDRATPNGEAVELLDQILSRLLATGTQIVAITGNHDSAERLHFGSAAMAGAGLHIRAERRSLADMGEPIEITGRSGASVQIVPVPYLDPYRIETGDLVRQHDAVINAVLAARIPQLRDSRRSVVMAHAFIAGGKTCGSERELAVGGTASVGAAAFKGVGYVALGHLHSPQSMLGGRAAYSGSPLPYSFSEERAKSVRIVECGDAINSREVPIGVGRTVRTITGPLAELLSSSKFHSARDSWVRAELTDTSLQAGAMDRLRERFPHILEVDQKGLRCQNAPTFGSTSGAVHTPSQVVDEYVTETFPDLVDEDQDFIHAAVDTMLRSNSLGVAA